MDSAALRDLRKDRILVEYDVDKIYYNGRIYSVDRDNNRYSAIGVEDGKIAFLGSDEEAEKIKAEERIDLQGKTMLPGFIDSHLHMLNYAFVAESYKMFDIDSIESAIDEGRKFAENMKEYTLRMDLRKRVES